MELHDRLKQKFSVLFTYLDERQRRVAAALEARSLGHGGVTAVAKATGMSPDTIRHYERIGILPRALRTESSVVTEMTSFGRISQTCVCREFFPCSPC